MSHILQPLQVILPELSPVEIRRATTGLIVDIENATSQYYQWANAEKIPFEKQNRIQSASRKIMRFIAEVTQLRDANANQKHLSQLNLEHIPEDIFLAIIELSQEIPEIYNILFRSPTDHHLFAVMFQKALSTTDKPIPLRHLRAAKLLDLQQEIPEQTVDRTKPFPVQIETVTYEQISHGTIALHEILTQKLDDMPTELRLAMQHLIDFLIDCLNPDEEKPATTRYEQLMHWPKNFHLGEIPESVIDAAARIKFFDATLHLAILGHDHAQTAIERDHITDHRTNRRRRELETPLAYNPISIAMQNTETRKDDCLADIMEMYAHGELSLLPAHMHTELALVSAHQHTQIATIMNGDSVTLFSRELFTRENFTRENLGNALANTIDQAAHAYRHVRTTPPKILAQQTLDFLGQLRENNRARIRRNELERWNTVLDSYLSNGVFFVPMGITSAKKIMPMLTNMMQEPKLLQPEALRKIIQVFFRELEKVDPAAAKKFAGKFVNFCDATQLEREIDRLLHEQGRANQLLTQLQETQKHILDQYELQIAFPDQIPSVKRLNYNDLHYPLRYDRLHGDDQAYNPVVEILNTQILPGRYTVERISKLHASDFYLLAPPYGNARYASADRTTRGDYGKEYACQQIMIPDNDSVANWDYHFAAIMTNGNYFFDTDQARNQTHKIGDGTILHNDDDYKKFREEEGGTSLWQYHERISESSDGTPILKAVKIIGLTETYVVQRQGSVQVISGNTSRNARWEGKNIANLNVTPEGHIFFMASGREIECKFVDKETDTYKEHTIRTYLFTNDVPPIMKVIQLESNDGSKEFLIVESTVRDTHAPQIDARHVKFDGENMKVADHKAVALERHYSDIFPLPDGRVVAISSKGIKIFDFTKEIALGIMRLFDGEPGTYLEQEFPFSKLHMSHHMMLDRKEGEDYVVSDLQVLPSGEIFFRLDGHTFYITENSRKIRP